MSKSLLQRLRICLDVYPELCIFLVALSARLLLIGLVPIPDNEGGDFLFYDGAARQLLATGGFGDITFIAPGFPIYLAWVRLFFPLASGGVMLFHILLGSFVAVLVYKIAALVVSGFAARLSGIMAAFWPLLVLETLSYGDSTILYTVLLLAAVYYFIKAVSGRGTLNAFIAGVLGGFALLVEPIFLYIPLVLAVWLFGRLRREFLPMREKGRRLLPLLVFLLGFAAVVTPWAYRNSIVLEHAAHVPLVVKEYETSALSPEHLSRISDALSVDGGWSRVALGAGHMFLVPYNLSLLNPKSPVLYKELLFSLRERAARMPPEVMLVLGLKGGLALLHLALLVLAFYGMRSASKGLNILLLLLTGYVLAAFLAIFLPLNVSSIRDISTPNLYFFPLVPLYIIFAALGLTSLREFLRARVGFTRSAS